MTFADIVGSDTASWIFLGIGLVSASLALIGPGSLGQDAKVTTDDPVLRRIISRWVPRTVGVVLLLGGAVLAGTGVGRLGWLSILAGVLCLAAVGFRRLQDDIREVSATRGVELRSKWDSEAVRHAELAHQISHHVRKQVSDLQERNHARVQQSLVSMDNAVRELALERDAFREHSVESFDDFANSLVRKGIWAPVSIYTVDDDGTGLKEAVEAMLREFSLTSAVEEPPVRGSWFQRFWARGRETATSTSVRGRLAQLEEAVHLEHLGKRRADIDKAKADSVATVLAAMKDQENAVVRIGSIIMIKTQGDLVVWTIGEMEAAAMEKNSDLLGDPLAALNFLRQCTDPPASADGDTVLPGQIRPDRPLPPA